MTGAVLSTFGAALLAPLLHRVSPRWSGRLCALVPISLFTYFASRAGIVSGGTPLRSVHSWIPSLGIDLAFRLDGLGLLFALLISGIGVLVTAYASAYLHGHRHLGRFHGLLLAFMGAMLGTVLAGDLVTMFVFWELTGICSWLLIGFDHERESSRKAALQALLVTGAGGLALLAGILLMGQAAGTTDLGELLAGGDAVRRHRLYLPVLLLVLAGAFTKSAQFPFHFWLPGAMAAPTPVSAYLHSATMVKLGIYLLARLSPVLGGTEEWWWCVVPAGVATTLLGGGVALLRTDLKQILAWSTVGALGTLTLLLGMGTPASVAAAMMFLPVHALYKSALFLAAGAVDHGTGTRDVSRLGGLAKAMPMVAAGAALAALSMAGLPPLAGFISKELMYEAGLGSQTAPELLVAAGVAANALAVAAALLVAWRPFFRPGSVPGPRNVHRVGMGLWLPPFLPALVGVGIGLFPGPVGRWLVAPAAEVVVGEPAALSLALWHGVNPAFLLSLATLAAGLAVFALRAPLLRMAPGRVDGQGGWGPERLHAAAWSGLLRLAAAVTRTLQGGRLRYYMMTVVGVTVCSVSYALVAGGGLPPEPPRPDGGVHEWLVASVILAGAAMATVTRSRLAAVAAIGTVGYGVALVYILYGAPDLAMTQFCIETLSIVLFVLVLHRLPSFTILSSRGVRIRDLLVALSIGGLMTVLVLLAVSRPMDSHLARWFLERSVPSGHGRNVVNVILVDFRALDTLGEITVLAVAALGVYGLLKGARAKGR